MAETNPDGSTGAPRSNPAGAGTASLTRALGSEAAEAVLAVAAEHLGCAVDGVAAESPRALSGGASRLTHLVEVHGSRSALSVIVQRERPGSAGANLPMATQVELLRRAADCGVPAPSVLASGGSEGSGFVVLEWLPGETVVRKVMRDAEPAPVREGLAAEAGRALAAVHRIDPDDVPPLPQDDPLQSMRGLLAMLGEPHPAFEVGLCWLEANRPPNRPPVVTHGDFRMGNLLVSPGGLEAVLDWELAHLGSPIEDLGWFCCRAWRFGSPLRAGGVGSAEQLVAGYVEAGGVAPAEGELDWWEAYATLRWGLICVLQASVHLRGLHRSVELAAIGRRAAECEEDLLELILGACDYEPPVDVAGDGVADTGDRTDGARRRAAPEAPAVPHDRPSASELIEAVSESLQSSLERLEGSAAFEARVSSRALEVVARELRLAPELAARHGERLSSRGFADVAALAEEIRGSDWASLQPSLLDAVREDVRDKLSVSNPGYWRGDT